jgi:hypothetical protein
LTEQERNHEFPNNVPHALRKRVELVKQTLMTSSTLDDDIAGELAVEVLRALDSIPETIR